MKRKSLKGNNKPRRVIITSDAYKRSWLVQRHGDVNDAIDWYSKQMGVDADAGHVSEDPGRQGHCQTRSDRVDVLLWFGSKAGTGLIVHEVMHAMVSFAEQMEAPINRDNEEIFAYQAGWLAAEIVSKLWS